MVNSSRSAASHDMWVRIFAASRLNRYSSLTTKPGDQQKVVLFNIKVMCNAMISPFRIA